MAERNRSFGPGEGLSVFDAVCIVIGITIGAGIFKTPGLVAYNTDNWQFMLGAWIIGGLFSLCGALCYGELASTYPQAGGEYVYLSNAYGRSIGFLFAWARMTVIQTGSIASIAYIFGDYASEITQLGLTSSTLYASFAVIILTILNMVGLKTSKNVQNILTAAMVAGLCAILVISLNIKPSTDYLQEGYSTEPGAFGLALVFVLYTYGGWNEGAYVTAELRKQRRNIVRVLVITTFSLIGIYLMTNIAYLRILGFNSMQESEVVGSTALGLVLGQAGSTVIAILVTLATLSSINGCIFTGARAIYAMGNDHPGFHWLAKWHRGLGTPFNALLAQGLMAIALIVLAGIGDRFRRSFETTIEYTAPVFWFFLLLTGISVFVLRKRYPTVTRSFKVPAFPLIVILFCIMAAYLLYSSLAYTKFGAVVGVCILLMGVPVYILSNHRSLRGK